MNAYYDFIQAQDEPAPPTDAVVRAMRAPHACAGEYCDAHVEFHRGEDPLCSTCAAIKRDAADAVEGNHIGSRRTFSPISQSATIAARNMYRRAFGRRAR